MKDVKVLQILFLSVLFGFCHRHSSFGCSRLRREISQILFKIKQMFFIVVIIDLFDLFRFVRFLPQALLVWLLREKLSVVAKTGMHRRSSESGNRDLGHSRRSFASYADPQKPKQATTTCFAADENW